VTDTGIGIPDEKQKAIFKPSRRPTDRPRAIRRNRMGLSISSQLVAMMGGEIRVESEPGKGARSDSGAVRHAANPEERSRERRGEIDLRGLADPDRRRQCDWVCAFWKRCFTLGAQRWARAMPPLIFERDHAARDTARGFHDIIDAEMPT